MRRFLGFRSKRPAFLRDSLVILSPDTEIARIHLWVPVGSARDTISGTAHFLEHVLLDFCQQSAHSNRIDGSFNAFASYYWTVFVWEGPPDSASSVIEVLYGLFSLPSALNNTIERQRRILRQEILELQGGGPEIKALERVCNTVYEGTALARSLVGTLQDLDSIQREHLVDFHGNYRSNDALLIVSCHQRAFARIRRATLGNSIVLPMNGSVKSSRVFPIKNKSIGVGDLIGEAAAMLATEIVPDVGVAFACVSQVLKEEDDGLLLHASRILEHLAVRDIPGTLRFNLRDFVVSSRGIEISSFLLPSRRFTLRGLVRGKVGHDPALIEGIVRRTLPTLGSALSSESIFRGLALRESNYWEANPRWSSSGQFHLGSAASTYGIATAVSLSKSTSISCLSWARLRELLSCLGESAETIAPKGTE
ncbi:MULTISPECIES: insulinase family protein [unclassified Ensifer]|uniref:insulinase family protein n=1 Tax=unclassified Ensifer TaxID=2633371 RepID=UPI00300FD8CE